MSNCIKQELDIVPSFRLLILCWISSQEVKLSKREGRLQFPQCSIGEQILVADDVQEHEEKHLQTHVAPWSLSFECSAGFARPGKD